MNAQNEQAWREKPGLCSVLSFYIRWLYYDTTYFHCCCVLIYLFKAWLYDTTICITLELYEKYYDLIDNFLYVNAQFL